MPLEISENVPLAPLTTLQVGGPARYFVSASNEQAVVDALEFGAKKNLEVFILGGGSNILVSDQGFDGLVVQVALEGISKSHAFTREENPVTPEGVTLTAAAGEDWDSFVEYCVANDLAGVECLSGIPGFVGGTPVQNVGAYGQEVSETIATVRCFDRERLEFVDLSTDDCEFTYRKSIFNSSQRDRYVVLAVSYVLLRGGQPKIAYKDIKDHFGTHRPTLRETRDAVLAIRRLKSMVIDANDPNRRSAGSFFKNPIVLRQRFDEIAAEFGSIPHFPANDGFVKIPAAWLIERSGFAKGYEHGNAGISTNHTLAIINRGAATADEILSLKSDIQSAVESKFDIFLQPEPVFVGFSEK
jgi:UDP-N-acetylmuramate dehydrogenase